MLNVLFFPFQSVGFLAVFTEAMLGVPQFYRNLKNRSTYGMRYEIPVFFVSVAESLFASDRVGLGRHLGKLGHARQRGSDFGAVFFRVGEESTKVKEWLFKGTGHEALGRLMILEHAGTCCKMLQMNVCLRSEFV